MTKRSLQMALIVSTLVLSWFAMMAVHEFGHVLHAWLSGGAVAKVSIPIAGFSRTDLSENPSPLFVSWGGALWGCVIPLLVWGLACAVQTRFRHVVRFVTGYCLIANGAYLGIGSFIGAGDAGDLLHYGSPQWLLLCFSAATIVPGLYLWHGQGIHFGLGSARGQVDRPTTGGVSVAAVVAPRSSCCWVDGVSPSDEHRTP